MQATQYTIALICVRQMEMEAVVTMLDISHPLPDIARKAGCKFACGRIGSHNVVVGCIAQDQHEKSQDQRGSVRLSQLITQLFASFPSIRVGLSVGVGSGVPTREYDIRLGDIVVGRPYNQAPGVIQYDGETIDLAGHVSHGGWEDRLPRLLVTTLTKMQAATDMDDPTASAYLSSSAGRHLRSALPKDRKDTLYRASYAHQGLEDCSKCDKGEIIKRYKRNSSSPVVHYGTIATGKHIIRDAMARDKINKDLRGVFCIDVEAYGIMDSFPWLIIRGISDYADSHKNNKWKKYAATTAAAYTKELLMSLAADLTATPTYGEAMTEQYNMITTTRNLDSGCVALDNYQSIMWQKTMSSLSVPDPSSIYGIPSKRRDEGSGRWFLDSSLYLEWKMKPKSFLWLNGLPGSGKTTLSSTIIQDLKESTSNSQVVLSFYFSADNLFGQSLYDMIRAFISQLHGEQWYMQIYIDHPHLHGNNQAERKRPLKETLQDMLCLLDKVYIVLDGLDKCPTPKELLKWIKENSYSELTNLHLLVSSQHDEEIASAFKPWMSANQEITFQKDNLDADIYQYIRERLENDKSLERWLSYPDLLAEILTILIKRSNGTFLLAALVLNSLSHCSTISQVRNELSTAPKTLDGIYSRILTGILDSGSYGMTTVLQFLLWSGRYLRLDEVVEAYSVHLDARPEFDPRSRESGKEEILRHCSNLVVTVPELHADSNSGSDASNGKEMAAKWLLAHPSLKDYLISESSVEFSKNFLGETNSKTSMVNICLAYLSCLDHDCSRLEMRQKFPFAEYSARYWTEYAAKIEETDESVQQTILHFFLVNKQAYATCNRLFNPDGLEDEAGDQDMLDLVSPIYYASLCGLASSVKLLLRNGLDANIKGGKYGNPLQAAASRGHEKIVYTLINGGAFIDCRGGQYGTALQAALSGGHKKIVKLLEKARNEQSQFIIQPSISLDTKFWPPQEHDDGENRASRATLGFILGEATEILDQDNERPGFNDPNDITESHISLAAQDSMRSNRSYEAFKQQSREFIEENQTQSYKTTIESLLGSSMKPQGHGNVRPPQAELRFAPLSTIEILEKDPFTLFDKLKGRIERLTGEEWDWWPLTQVRKPLAQDFARIQWRCNCGEVRWTEISVTKARELRTLIDEMLPTYNSFSNIFPSASTGSSPDSNSAHQTGPSQVLMQRDTTTMPLPDSGGSSSDASNAEGERPSKHFVHSGSSQFVFLVVRKADYKANSINVRDSAGFVLDEHFFKTLKKQYIISRGKLRYWLSPWRYSGCEFYRFTQFGIDAVAPVIYDFPDHISSYEPIPVEPKPPITMHEFKVRFYQTCDRPRKYHSIFHNCGRFCSRASDVVSLLPRRELELDLSQSRREDFWGIYAKDGLAFRWVAGIILLLVMPCAIFFFTWIFALGNRSQLSTAGVPWTLAVATISIGLTLIFSHG